MSVVIGVGSIISSGKSVGDAGDGGVSLSDPPRTLIYVFFLTLNSAK